MSVKWVKVLISSVFFLALIFAKIDMPENITMIYYISAMVVIICGCLRVLFLGKTFLKKSISAFKPAIIKKNGLLYMVYGAFMLFNLSVFITLPYILVYYKQYLGMKSYLIIMLPSLIVSMLVAAFYHKLYDMQGFRVSLIPGVILMSTGYIFLFFGRYQTAVFVGVMLFMLGAATGHRAFELMIKDRLPEEDNISFEVIRLLAENVIPSFAGIIIAFNMLKGTKHILNNDGIYLYWLNENVYVAAFITLILMCITLPFIFDVIRNGHYELITPTGEEFMKADTIPWQEYPRPQMKRDGFRMLNGEWKLNGESVLVPFPPQSILSGYKSKVKDIMIYETTFEIPKSFTQGRILLHFGAVDQIARVRVNRTPTVEHTGGYLPFTIDITQAVTAQEKNYLRIEVRDSLSKEYPYGKQSKNRGGMWYTPVSGIWQSVWLENVPENYIKDVKMTPDLKGVDIELDNTVFVSPFDRFTYRDDDKKKNTCDLNGFDVVILLENGEKIEKHFEGLRGYLDLSEVILEDGSRYKPLLWTPETPNLYYMEIRADEDRIQTYFALRTIEIDKKEGKPRVLLNGNPIFMHGVLDQGYFSDGIYLPAKPEEYRNDVLRMKELGINLLRKHIKVEPEIFYYECDRLGMLVMQDMVNSGEYSFLFDTAFPTVCSKNKKDNFTRIEGKREVFFREHTRQTIEHLYNHPCIVAYTIFNEGWGQFNSDEMYDFVKELDSTRLVDSTSGWFAQQKNDFDSEHIYFKTISLKVKDRPLLVSECGGYTMMIPGHIYSKYNTYGYGTCTDKKELTGEIVNMYEKMIIPSVKDGLCGCVYTQLSDVEDEINGLYTYDRKVCKVDKLMMQDIAKRLEKALSRGIL